MLESAEGDTAKALSDAQLFYAFIQESVSITHGAEGGIAPNHVIARSEFEVHRQMFTEVGAGRSSEVERSLMVRWVVGSILHGVDPLSYFSFQPVLHDWCNKGRGMCYPVCGMVHIK